MNKGTRVKHKEYGLGTIKEIIFNKSKREMYLVEFDVSNSKLHNGFGIVADYKGYFSREDELEVVDGFVD